LLISCSKTTATEAKRQELSSGTTFEIPSTMQHFFRFRMQLPGEQAIPLRSSQYRDRKRSMLSFALDCSEGQAHQIRMKVCLLWNSGQEVAWPAAMFDLRLVRVPTTQLTMRQAVEDPIQMESR
jgi:hypothetical protein